MKSIKKIIAVAFCAAFVLASGFANDDTGKTVTAVYENAAAESTVTFYSDDTFTIVTQGQETVCGTYEGNAATDGEILVTAKQSKDEHQQFVDIPSPTVQDLKITKGTFTFEDAEYTRK